MGASHICRARKMFQKPKDRTQTRTEDETPYCTVFRGRKVIDKKREGSFRPVDDECPKNAN